ncbi:MAG TPA: HAD-IA family hydrolase [Anaerolineales bacterium]|nr:HAD-IA family hydrolase [Anaerolineales bacterium]
MIKNIIWDFDGTLYDTYPAIAKAFEIALRELGKETPLDEIESLAKNSVGGCLGTLAEMHGLDVDALEQEFLKAYGNMTEADSPPYAHAKTICEYIVANGGKNVIITHRRKGGTEALLASHGLTDYFAGWYTHDDGFPRKPDPTVFHHALETYELVPEETINVGDRELDILAGQRAGLFSILFQGGPGDSIPDLVIEDFGALYRIILEQNQEQE